MIRQDTPRAVLFDFDGVVAVGSNEAYFPVYHAALEEAGYHLSAAEERKLILSYWSWPSSHFFLHLFPDDRGRAETATRTYRERLFSDTFLSSFSVSTRLGPMLSRLREAGIRLGIVSGANAELLTRVLGHNGLDSHFGCVISGYDFAREQQKPSPYMLLLACERLDCKPATALYVGDSDTDLEAARRAGMPFCAVLTGNLNRGQAESLSADWIVESAADLEGTIALPSREAGS